MPLRALFLDVGQTLLHEQPPRETIYAGVAARRGIAVTPEAMRAEMRRVHAELPRFLGDAFRYDDTWFRAFIRAIFVEGLGLEAGELLAVEEELFERFQHEDTFRVYPGAEELLEAARSRGLVLGVISNWSARLPNVLTAVGLANSFDFVLCSALERMEKPELAFFRAAVERAGVRPEEALHAGDHPRRDVAGACAAGLAAVLVDHHGRHPEPVPGTVRVTGLHELRAVILDRT